jgi:hypothetical protein
VACLGKNLAGSLLKAPWIGGLRFERASEIRLAAQIAGTSWSNLIASSRQPKFQHFRMLTQDWGSILVELNF